jgi:hypothetical protein
VADPVLSGEDAELKSQPCLDLVANSVLLLAGVALLVAGYLSLSRGSITMAPVLLVTGYCVFIPASLLVRGGGSASGE